MSDVDFVRTELAANSRVYTGLKPDRIVDVMNNPQKTGTSVSYRGVTLQEVYDALGKITIAKLQAALEDYSVATNEAGRTKAAAGVELYGRLTDIGFVDVEPGSTGRACLDAAVAALYITAGEYAAIVALGTQDIPVLQTLWQVWGWDHSVTVALVEEALSSG